MKFWAIFIAIVCVLVGVTLVQYYKPALYHDERFIAGFMALIPLSLLGFAVSDFFSGGFRLNGLRVTKNNNPVLFYGYIAAVCLFSAFVLIGIAKKFLF